MYQILTKSVERCDLYRVKNESINIRYWTNPENVFLGSGSELISHSRLPGMEAVVRTTTIAHFFLRQFTNKFDFNNYYYTKITNSWYNKQLGLATYKQQSLEHCSAVARHASSRHIPRNSCRLLITRISWCLPRARTLHCTLSAADTTNTFPPLPYRPRLDMGFFPGLSEGKVQELIQS